MRVLLIEDDPATRTAIETMLSVEGFEVRSTGYGEDGLGLASQESHDLILLDLNLPDIHGYELLTQLRAERIDTPVLILSGMSEIATRICGLRLGADDFLGKPFHREELLARIRAVMRRAQGCSQRIVQIGKLAINFDAKTIDFAGSRFDVTPKEFAILELLALRKGNIVSKDMLLNHLYGEMGEPHVKIIDVFVCKVRRKLRQLADGQDYIRTVWGGGYRLSEPDELARAA